MDWDDNSVLLLLFTLSLTPHQLFKTGPNRTAVKSHHLAVDE